ncbi:hypothetical protein M153_5001000937 [Pseudoloma neurophilia]|uniref:Uncharacterized protein n=1 Tax=Pseudoloma neurophilia TaxID=146866 RepID=A0A0R0LSQ3_9MICR|nr:hypothetical protein M153_5001000937 [Pseudoloma neurophilia]
MKRDPNWNLCGMNHFGYSKMLERDVIRYRALMAILLKLIGVIYILLMIRIMMRGLWLKKGVLLEDHNRFD